MIWLTLPELVDRRLPGLPRSVNGLRRLAERERWTRAEWRFPENPSGRWRRRAGTGGGVEFADAVLPAKARSALAAEPPESAPGDLPEASETGEKIDMDADRAAAWARFATLTEARQAEARRWLALIEQVDALVAAGATKAEAVATVAAGAGAGASTLWERIGRLAGCDAADRLPRLADRRVGRADPADIDGDAWEFFKADYLRLERPPLASCYRRLQRAGAAHGWTIPSARTIERKLTREISAAVIVYCREGERAAQRLYPAQKRDKSGFHALEAVNADGRMHDVWVQWPDGEISRPCTVAFQDVYSGKVLSWRRDKSETKEVIRLAFGDLVERFGIPDQAWFDNGRSFAAKSNTGGASSRFRFKIRNEDPIGLLPALGVQVHFVTPYHGQAKPIERAWRDMASDLDRHPAMAGAWCGNDPMSKPENYRSRAVPLALFDQVLAEGIAEHNARTGRRSAVCAGRSFDETFAESYATSAIRRATTEQRRMWLLASEKVTARADNGSVWLAGNRYWAEFLVAHRGGPVMLRFDPQALHGAVHVYALDGRYIGEAPCVEDVGYADQGAAQQAGRDKRRWLRAQKEIAAIERKFTIDDVAAMLPRLDVEPEAPPSPKVVRLARGPELPEREDDGFDAPDRAFGAAMAKLRQAQG